jgi:hypothetical protein
VKNILDATYLWPTMNKDVHEFCQTYDMCQRIGNMLAQNMEKLIITMPKNLSKNGDWILLDLLNQ